MSKIIRTSGECILCGNKENDCGTNENGAVFCLGYAGARKGEKINNYICTKEQGTGHTATFMPDNSEEWTEERRREWEEKKARRKAQQEEIRRRQISIQLPAANRDKYYRQILNQLKLSESDRASLSKRGLTDAEIDDSLFKSARPWQKIIGTFPANLPGVLRGDTLNVGKPGVICPVFSVDGLIVGLKVRKSVGDGSNRYFWLTSKTTKDPDGCTPHLNGELPLAFFAGDSSSGTAYVTEGVEIKPRILSLRTNSIVLGGGRYWQSSPVQAERVINRLKSSGISKIVLCPDAGDVLNDKGVPQKWIDEAKFFDSQGFEIVFEWHGQVTKEHSDIDELNDYSQLKFINVDEFKKLIQPSKSKQKLTEEISQDAIDAGQFPPSWQDKVATVQKKLHTLTHEPDILISGDEKYLPEDLIYKFPTKGAVLLSSSMGSGKSVMINRVKKLRCGGYWEEIVKPPSQLSLINVEPEIERVYHEKTGVKFISITPRVALGRGQAIEWDITWIEDGDLTEKESYNYEGELIQTATFLETADGIGLCWDSLPKLIDRDWSNSVIVMDELELGLSHVATSSTCKDRRPKILSLLQTKLKECLDGNGLVIGADANLTDVSYDYLSDICPGHKPFIIKKDYIRPDADKWDITFYSGKRDEVLSQIEDWVSDKDCEPIAVATDNQAEAEALANHLIKKYPHLAANHNGLIRIDSKITQSDFGKSFVKRANEKIQEHQPKILIYTPSLGVGCSLDIPYFKYVYGMFFGNLEPSQCRQMLARVRQPVPRIVWCAERGKVTNGDDFNSFLPEAIKKQIFNYNDLTAQVIDIALHLAKQQAEGDSDAEILPKLIENLQSMMGSDGTWNNPHIDLFCKLKARRNFALSQLSLQLRQELIDEGHIINDYASEEKTNAGDCVTEEKTEIKLNKALKTSKSDDIPLELAKEINRKPNPTDEEQHQVSKAFLKDELPEIGLTPEFIYKAVYKDNRRWLNGVKLFWMTQNVNATQEADRKHWKYKLKQFCDGVAYLPDVRTYSAKVEAINKIGLFEAIPLDDFETEYHDDSEALKEWLKKSVLPHRKLLKDAFNISVNKNTQAIKFINQLLNKVGLKLKQIRKSGDVKYYSLDAELATDADRAEVLRSLDLKREMQLAAPMPEPMPELEPAPMPEPFIADADLIAPLVAEQMLKLSTREEFEELAETITPEQKAAAWKLIPIEQRRQIQALFREDIQKPETVPVSSLELELPPTDPTTLLHRVEMLRSGIKQGIDAIKNILKPWNEIWRWEAVLEWEAIAVDELLKVEDTAPGFYQLLSEAVLPMEEVMFCAQKSKSIVTES
ncbi:plasmid replication protein, CyRepA1 family [Anabaena sp. CCY 0017]|uniref:plasmid replication protein, CyRepA1 family n=1 Tax=Anabaena sp. CCY 0017 TaxID=3103866 RepID=UPI0039C6AE2D